MKFDITPAWNTLRSMVGTFLASVPRFVLAVLVFVLFYALSKLVVSMSTRLLTRRGCSHYACRVIGKLANITFVIMGILVALAVALPSFKASDLIQVLGIGTVAIGFAFRDVLQNFLAGIIILLSKSFQVGDEVEFGGQRGIVEDTQIRATVLRGEDGRLILIPNTKLFTEPVVVHVRTELSGEVRASGSGASAPARFGEPISASSDQSASH